MKHNLKICIASGPETGGIVRCKTVRLRERVLRRRRRRGRVGESAAVPRESCRAHLKQCAHRLKLGRGGGVRGAWLV